MGAPNRGLQHKRMSIGLTEELDRAIIELRKTEKYCRCSYVECIRVLMEEGARAIAARRQSGGG